MLMVLRGICCVGEMPTRSAMGSVSCPENDAGHGEREELTAAEDPEPGTAPARRAGDLHQIVTSLGGSEAAGEVFGEPQALGGLLRPRRRLSGALAGGSILHRRWRSGLLCGAGAAPLVPGGLWCRRR